MTVQGSAAKGLDYQPCYYGTSKNLFRGPKQRLRGDYIACLGSTETFGRFIETPYPGLLEETLGLPAVNLGCQRAGIDAFLSCSSLIDICAMAKATVIQIMGAPNMSNRHYTVDPRRNERFLRASKQLKAIYPEVDFRDFETTSDLLTGLARVCPSRLHQVRQELQTAWVARMRTLIDMIGGPVILLWASDHAPYSKEDGGTICRDPVFVDRAMLNAIAPRAAAVVEVVAKANDIASGLGEMVYGPFEVQAAKEMLGPVAHRWIAAELTDLLSGLLEIDAKPQSLDVSLQLLKAGATAA
ncbi:MAG: DUF6473 family protein [Rhodobacter sp.]|nr:DUF6473 family protein [Rhodobacter sp.]